MVIIMKRVSVWKTLIIWMIVIAVLAMFMKPRHMVSTEAFDGYLTIQGNSGYTISIVYDEIQYIELRENLDYGTVVNGLDEKKEKSGIWENEEFGEYQLCVNAKIDTCIILYMEPGIQVINFESDKSTESLYEAILNQI